jgi:hypothetical protein
MMLPHLQRLAGLPHPSVPISCLLQVSFGSPGFSTTSLRLTAQRPGWDKLELESSEWDTVEDLGGQVPGGAPESLMPSPLQKNMPLGSVGRLWRQYLA